MSKSQSIGVAACIAAMLVAVCALVLKNGLSSPGIPVRDAAGNS